MIKTILLLVPLLLLGSISIAQDIASKTQMSKDDIAEQYTPIAVAIVHSDTILNGPDAISTYFVSKGREYSTIEQIFEVEANEARGLSYAINQITLANNTTEKQLVIWKKEKDQQRKEFEYSQSSSIQTALDTTEISTRRTRWMELCNAHQVEELVSDLYSENTLYFNHRPLVQGREALIGEYGYMNYENYSLRLNPLIVEVVNDSTVFEVGQCQGSYGGKYILIWKKEEDGEWRIFIDSNI